MDNAVTLAVLRELGVLFQSTGVDEAARAGALDGRDHQLHPHTPLWDYENPVYARPFAGGGKPLYRTLPAGTSLAQALEHTRLLVFLGAADTPALREALGASGALVLLFDQDPGRVADLAQALGPKRLAGRMHIFLGDTEAFLPPLGMLIPAELFQAGFPACFSHPQLAGASPLYAEECARLLELLFFRHVVYPLSGQSNNHGLPLRPMTRGLFYDQHLHACRNAADMALAPDIGVLRRAFQGETAILVAAGPALPEQLDYIRARRDSAVVIAVNNALKPMLEGGVRPHFVVVNDTSVLTRRSWEGLAPMPDIALVAHCLTDLGDGIFPLRFLFGNHRQELYGARPSLRLHGSVITTAYSLARHMGCLRCVLAGVELCSGNPWTLSYARGSIHEGLEEYARPLTHAFPQLIPVTNRLGLTRYTTPNFLDASRWLLDEVRSTGLPCVNMTRGSLVFGQGVEFDPDPAIAPTGNLARRLRQLAGLKARPRRPEPVKAALRAELASWRSIEAACQRMEQGAGPGYLEAAGQMLAQFDEKNVSYLVQRCPGYDNGQFHARVFGSGDPEVRAEGFRHYFQSVARMARSFQHELEASLRRLGG